MVFAVVYLFDNAVELLVPVGYSDIVYRDLLLTVCVSIRFMFTIRYQICQLQNGRI